MSSPTVEIFADRPAVADAVATRLLGLLRKTVSADGIAHVSLTGGGAGIAALSAVAAQTQHSAEAPDWSRVHFWWGDERLLPDRDDERNETQAWDALLSYLVNEHGLPPENIHPMPTSEQAADPEVGAQIYAQELESCSPAGGIQGPHGQLNMPQMTVVLLGVGPDAHINSLFPGKETLSVIGKTTAGESDSPKPPPMRVTLTFDAVQSAHRVWLVTAGADKAPAVARSLSTAADIINHPAAGAQGTEETVWFLDQAAAANI